MLVGILTFNGATASVRRTLYAILNRKKGYYMPGEKIDSCPFCGGSDFSCDGHQVECEDCHAVGPCFFPVPDRKSAIDAWNHRADTKVGGSKQRTTRKVRH